MISPSSALAFTLQNEISVTKESILTSTFFYYYYCRMSELLAVNIQHPNFMEIVLISTSAAVAFSQILKVSFSSKRVLMLVSSVEDLFSFHVG